MEALADRRVTVRPRASFVIPTRDRPDELAALITSLLRQSDSEVEIIVMEDGTSGATGQMLSCRFPEVRFYRIAANRGPAFQRNRGIAMASGDIVFAVDDDTLFVSRHTIEQTLAAFDEPRVAAVGIPFINVRQDETVQQCAPSGDAVFVEHAFVGAAHAVRRDIFLRLGGYREHFFYMGEEGDLCLRLLNAGYVTRLCVADPIHHLESPRRDLRLADYYGRRNDVLGAWHNTPARYLPGHLASTTLRGLAFGLGNGRPLAMLRGLAGGYIDCVRHRRERLPVAAPVYRLYRQLKVHGPRRLEEIAPLLPAIGTGL